ncbi:MAG: hypothetical protein RI935_44 [Candidatus Parcubacteria bacterium]|jgi:segregation and condensation protein B
MLIEKIITILYLSGDPISCDKIASLCEVNKEEVVAAIKELEETASKASLLIVYDGENLSLVTKKEQSALVEKFKQKELEGDLTPANLQVLTLVAYLDTPNKETISYIRGVQSSQSIRALLIRGLIKKEGESLSLTTEAFKYLGITKKEELPDFERINQSFTKKLNEKEGQ